MTEQTMRRGYDSFAPEAVAPPRREIHYRRDAAEGENARPDRLGKTLTWAILSVCLAVWAVLGFVLWVPLLLRSMVRFSFSLSHSMLRGVEPVEAGRILRDTVSFYRRGFVVAVEAVFGKPQEDALPTEQRTGRKAEKMSARFFLRELVLASVIWYLLLFGLGVVEVSPVQGWVAIWTLPWAEYWGSLSGWFESLF